jgi:hypothetical protein
MQFPSIYAIDYEIFNFNFHVKFTVLFSLIRKSIVIS